MKKLLILLLGIILGFAAAVGLYMATKGDVSWEEYLETQLIPNAVLAMSGTGSLVLVAMPIISRVNQALEKFTGATKDINTTADNGERQHKELEKIKEEFRDIATELKQEVKNSLEISKNTEKMVKLGFCNIDELVKKGYASKIGKVGQNEDGSKEKTQP